MKVVLANPRGFCAGVDRAIDIVERALELFGPPIHVRHEVVHNRAVVDRLRSLGAVHVCNSGSPTFSSDLVEALKATSATIAFDATGGGTLASQILSGMEQAANATATQYSRYGSSVHKQAYIYGYDCRLQRSVSTPSMLLGSG